MLPRSIIARSNVLATRRIIARRPAGSIQRFQSTSSSSGPPSYKRYIPYLVAGLAIGACYNVAHYVWYYTSGIRTVVQKSREIKDILRSKREKIFKRSSDNQEIDELADGKSADVQKVAKETSAEVIAVLRDKGKKAKELAESAKAGAEKRAKN
ncbi:uncharacterized protein FOMMEDRAFT_167920 [Fomitiporia mediterranea MF3/22]|uniref:uncharacterized protein n=1 Tax=Fomitiporia mediterranea (strain MF3/22) TaxID=694068 RepID=UPI0004407BDF|nr:uncharacterized protein FOMMEDRAFT_167920 [Fomitiporia mediterranea MF3/22]EJD02751.1 hypothetical protein FOMMEDRAFT_167920 [Fomitiporia mediterranea MF3/22]